MPSLSRTVAVGLVLLLTQACTSHLQQKEAFLQEAGFRAVRPVTAAQAERLRALPQGHMTHMTKNGHTVYMLADAKKNLLLVGGTPQLERYQQILYTKKVDPEIENRAFDKAIEMDGGAWGPWGGMYGPFIGFPMMY